MVNKVWTHVAISERLSLQHYIMSKQYLNLSVGGGRLGLVSLSQNYSATRHQQIHCHKASANTLPQGISKYSATRHQQYSATRHQQIQCHKASANTVPQGISKYSATRHQQYSATRHRDKTFLVETTITSCFLWEAWPHGQLLWFTWANCKANRLCCCCLTHVDVRSVLLSLQALQVGG